MLHLPLHWREISDILTSRRVGSHRDLAASGVHLGLIGNVIMRDMCKHRIAFRTVGILVVIDEPRVVVALEGERHLQVVTQVIA